MLLGAWAAQRHALDQRHQVRIGAPAARSAPGQSEPGQASGSVAVQLSLRGAYVEIHQLRHAHLAHRLRRLDRGGGDVEQIGRVVRC